MYRVEYLPSFEMDLIEAEVYLYEFSPAAVDKLTSEIVDRMGNLNKHPLMYPIYEHDKRFRFIPLSYKYICFYRVDEVAKLVMIHRILHEMRDISAIL